MKIIFLIFFVASCSTNRVINMSRNVSSSSVIAKNVDFDSISIKEAQRVIFATYGVKVEFEDLHQESESQKTMIKGLDRLLMGYYQNRVRVDVSEAFHPELRKHQPSSLFIENYHHYGSDEEEYEEKSGLSYKEINEYYHSKIRTIISDLLEKSDLEITLRVCSREIASSEGWGTSSWNRVARDGVTVISFTNRLDAGNISHALFDDKDGFVSIVYAAKIDLSPGDVVDEKNFKKIIRRSSDVKPTTIQLTNDRIFRREKVKISGHISSGSVVMRSVEDNGTFPQTYLIKTEK